MTAEDLIKNNSLTDIEVTGNQTVVFSEIALTAVNMAREEVKCTWEKATTAFVKDAEEKKIQKAIKACAEDNMKKRIIEEIAISEDEMRQKAIDSFIKNCPCWSRFQKDRKCNECAYMKDFRNQLY